MCLGTADARFFSVQACRRQKQRWGGPGTRASQCVAGAHGGRESQVDVSRERSRVRWLARTGAAVAPGGVPMESVELEGGGLRAAGCGLRSTVCGGDGGLSPGRRVSRACRAAWRTEGHAVAEEAVWRAAALWSNALTHPFDATGEGLWAGATQQWTVDSQQSTGPPSGWEALCEGRLRGGGMWIEVQRQRQRRRQRRRRQARVRGRGGGDLGEGAWG